MCFSARRNDRTKHGNARGRRRGVSVRAVNAGVLGAIEKRTRGSKVVGSALGRRASVSRRAGVVGRPGWNFDASALQRARRVARGSALVVATANSGALTSVGRDESQPRRELWASAPEPHDFGSGYGHKPPVAWGAARPRDCFRTKSSPNNVPPTRAEVKAGLDHRPEGLWRSLDRKITADERTGSQVAQVVL